MHTSASPQVPPTDNHRTRRVRDLFPVSDWFGHHAMRSFPIMLFLALVCVPTIALVTFSANISATRFTVAAWIFAAYFAVAWLLLLGIIVQPMHVTRTMLALVAIIALATQVPLAIVLESALQSTDATLGLSIATVGIPEELVKAIPVLAIAVLYHRRNLMPRDYLFLGALSGLAFGAAEVVHYFTTNSVAAFYHTVQSASPAIRHLIATGHSAPASIFTVLVGPVWFFIIEFVWRFVTDPITHACWAGITGYFIGLAMTRRYAWYLIAWVGLVIAAVLHGLNDWSRVNGHPLWILIVVASALLFLCYAKVGARVDQQFEAALPPVFRTGRTPAPEVPAAPHGQPARAPAEGQPAQAPADRQPAGAQAGRGLSVPAQQLPATTAIGGRLDRPWWMP
jgi:RsiW-degrading membrane proteinase PrsW (M82 family)